MRFFVHILMCQMRWWQMVDGKIWNVFVTHAAVFERVAMHTHGWLFIDMCVLLCHCIKKKKVKNLKRTQLQTLKTYEIISPQMELYFGLVLEYLICF